jgi:tetratricopeptide (TPR) repeat protein
MRKVTLAIVALAIVGGGAWILGTRKPQAPTDDMLVRKDLRSEAGKAAAEARADADRLYAANPREAEERYRQFVDGHKSVRDPHVQDEVGSARIRLGYLAAKRKDYTAAREAFQEAATEYRGTGKMGAEYGGIPDQAAYQAAVTLVAEGKSAEAERAFVQFIKERPLSPLVTASRNRLVRLNGGKPKDEWDNLLQSALDKQQERARFEMSVCGPKAIVHVLQLIGRPKTDYAEIAKLCGTNDKGTSLEGMRTGLKALGLGAHGYRLNRRDFASIPLPAIVLSDRHYVVVETIGEEFAVVFDPTLGSQSRLALPPLDEPAFQINVLTLKPVSLEGNH